MEDNTMKGINWMLTLLVALLVAAAPAMAQQGSNQNPPKHGLKFVDEDGDGYNDNAPDADGDGIPNGLDPDYTGVKMRGGVGGFIDEDGDGINDNAPDSDGDGIPNGMDPDFDGAKMRHGFVDADGDGINDNLGGRQAGRKAGFGPMDGGPGQAGATARTGEQDGTGPKGSGGRKRGSGRGN